MNFEFIKLATFTRLNLATSKTKLGLGKYWDYCVPRSTINPVLYPYLFDCEGNLSDLQKKSIFPKRIEIISFPETGQYK